MAVEKQSGRRPKQVYQGTWQSDLNYVSFDKLTSRHEDADQEVPVVAVSEVEKMAVKATKVLGTDQAKPYTTEQ